MNKGIHMKAIIIYFAIAVIAMTFFSPIPAKPEVFDVDTLVFHGDPGKFINIVILGDGYTEAELIDFKSHAESFVDYFFKKAPFSSYKNYFNVYCIYTPSIESGVKHPLTAEDCNPQDTTQPFSNPENFYGSTFDCAGIHRLVCPTNYSALSGVLADNFPNYDLVFLLANSKHYGGSGGGVATATLSLASNEIAVHEIGHTFAYLADEYWAGLQYAYEKPNMTQNNNPLTIKWKNWLPFGSGIGIYKFPGYDWYKPTEGVCEMENLNREFCAVCRETIVERIHSLVNPIMNYYPLEPELELKDSLSFSIDLLKPQPNTLKMEWSLNGNILTTHSDSVSVSAGSLKKGQNQLIAKLNDTTSWVRSDSHPVEHIFYVEWTITQSDIGVIDISSEANRFSVKIYPNPVEETVNILFDSELERIFNIRIFSNDGKLIDNVKTNKDGEIKLDVSAYAAGAYYLEFSDGAFKHYERFVKQ